MPKSLRGGGKLLEETSKDIAILFNHDSLELRRGGLIRKLNSDGARAVLLEIENRLFEWLYGVETFRVLGTRCKYSSIFDLIFVDHLHVHCLSDSHR